jgi:hypothetical protein
MCIGCLPPDILLQHICSYDWLPSQQQMDVDDREPPQQAAPLSIRPWLCGFGVYAALSGLSKYAEFVGLSPPVALADLACHHRLD